MPKVLQKSHFFLLLSLAGLGIFAAISIYYIAFFHVSPLSRDQWHMYAPYFEHGLLDAALTPMSTHRHLFPFFIFDIDMRLFGGRNHFLILFGSFFDCLIILLLLIVLIKDPTLSNFEKLAFSVLIISALTWLVNIAQLGWGFMSTQYYLAIFAYLFSIYCAYRSCHQTKKATHTSTMWIIVSISCGVISTFSFGMGILVWPALLYFAYLWHAPAKWVSLIILSLIFCLILFLLLPGGQSIEDSLLFSLKYTIAFLFQLAGGPVYYLLKSYRYFDTETIKSIASTIGIIATTIGILLLLYLLKNRRQLSLFSTLCCALVLVGLGTAALISFTRNPFFLDVWVDRYQLWGTLFWLGMLPLLYTELCHWQKDTRSSNHYVKKTFLACLLVFPLAALPSQLDMGARLSEYKIRVQQALLAYQVGIPDKRSAEEALHWNWENKLTPFFTVLKHIKINKKNIYYNNYFDAMNKNIDELKLQRSNTIALLHIIKVDSIVRDDLMDLKNITTANDATLFNAPLSNNIVAYQISANVITPKKWTHALVTNETGTIIGLGIAIDHSKLPRSQLKYINVNYNFFAVVRNDRAENIRFYFLNDSDTSTVSDAMDFTLK